MKILTKEDNVIVYVVDDTTVIQQDNKKTYIGEPVDCYFYGVTTETSSVYEGVTNVPDGTKPKIHCYDGSSFYINDDSPQAKTSRLERNTLLTETDWWCLSDRTATQAQLDYRQALRDITSHANWPNLNEADWPVKPV